LGRRRWDKQEGKQCDSQHSVKKLFGHWLLSWSEANEVSLALSAAGDASHGGSKRYLALRSRTFHSGGLL
jgi:hypothetical protein